MKRLPRIEQYGLIGDMQTSAHVCDDGSIDWLCLPRFDSPAHFAALLGTQKHGAWRMAPVAEYEGGAGATAARRYVGESLVLETVWTTPSASAKVTDFMPPRDGAPQVIRIVEGTAGQIAMASTLRARPGYGRVSPWIHEQGGRMIAEGGGDALWLDTSTGQVEKDGAIVSSFTVTAGESVAFVLSWGPSHGVAPELPDPEAALAATLGFWEDWTSQCSYDGPHWEAVVRSLITLKAMTYAPSGGIVAAPTTSLPEEIGGRRNWDYRYTWLRDASTTLGALLGSGYGQEAEAWRRWLLRAVAGDPENLQIMYGITGERDLPERELGWLPGYENSGPVRIGNGAVDSKVMAWAAIDKTIRLVEAAALDADLFALIELREAIHQEVCTRGFDPVRNTFTQFYGSQEVDAALLLIPRVGFLPPDDPRVLGTVDAVRQQLSTPDGLIRRYPTAGDRIRLDGLNGDEGTFLLCSFWMVDALALTGRLDEAHALFDRLLALRTDLGLLAEEYDPTTGRQLGNFPQAYSHIGVIGSALLLQQLDAGAPAAEPDVLLAAGV
ncbi:MULTISPECIES: glycoside hydrolase family 15 protein [unclassified Streptomyces]|uniref:glycoside hydrolase family 15 protein n=1 Tax=unclassified Streptomyces TaxID=2593676 RepID=UPI00236668CD|nr:MULTISPECIES: glycoside hydrolase family 15 protein [unclassified Streptomyces]MDF3140968.1 glycoside hydrolase family 15 protein [Streptomyces sp. T21Q-yed]WDF43638.1 glycoside hydrolase family 15 protein [Streptomyces sp. T12]